MTSPVNSIMALSVASSGKMANSQISQIERSTIMYDPDHVPSREELIVSIHNGTSQKWPQKLVASVHLLD